MIAVLFEVTPYPEHKQTYMDIAQSLKSDLAAIDGFISVERFQSLTDPCKLLSLSYFKDEEAVQRWRLHGEHQQAQLQGKNTLFQSYHIRVAAVVRDYHFPKP